MPLLGAHMSVAGGLHKAVEAAVQLGMETVQIFTHSPSQWSAAPVEGGSGWRPKELSDSEVRQFREAIAASSLQAPCAHDSYLINLASPDDGVWERSMIAFQGELARAEALGLRGVVMHPGSHLSSSIEDGLARIVQAFDRIHAATAGYRVETWLEVTAGQGTNLGCRFSDLAWILNRCADSSRFGVCVDTCHLFAAGYPLDPGEAYDATFQQFEEQIGLRRIRAFHLNDSKKGLGSRVDHHEHIGEGCIGLEPFRRLLNDPRFHSLPMYLETKKEDRDGEPMDAVNLRQLRSLIGAAAPGSQLLAAADTSPAASNRKRSTDTETSTPRKRGRRQP